MTKDRNPMIERILNLTLEIVYLLTGEDYLIVKKPKEHVIQSVNPYVLEESYRTKRNNEKKILELTNQIIQLLTGEVPTGCEDAMACFSLEEQTYLEDKNLDMMMKNHQPFSTFDGSLDRTISDAYHSSLNSSQYVNKDKSGTGINQEIKCLITNQLHKRQKTSCNLGQDSHSSEEGNPSNIYTATKHKQSDYPSIQIKEESASCQIGNLTDTAINTVRTHSLTAYTSFQIKEESDSWRTEKFTDIDSYTPTEHKQKEYTSSHIKEDPISCEEVNLTDTYTPTGFTQTEYTATHIKEEAEEGTLTYNDICIPNGHKQTEYTAHVEEKSNPWETGTLTDMYAHTDLAQTEYTYTYINEGFIGNLADLYTSTNHTWVEDASVHSTKESVLCAKENVTDIYTYPSYRKSVLQKKNHIRKKHYPCGECGKNFGRNEHLVNHERTHTGEKPFSCSECGKCFVQSSHLVKHQRIHTGEKPFLCNECGKRFTCSSHLVRHRKTHTGQKPSSCSICGKGCVCNLNLLNRQKGHAGEVSV